MVRQMIAPRAVLGLEMTDHRFDGSAPSQLAFDLGVSRRFWPDV
jgi:hypothetical protein